MSTVVDYVGRQVDLLAFRGIFPQRTGQTQVLAQQLVRTDDGGVVTAGMEKLVQKVLLILLTKTGSRQYAATDGTAFMSDAEKGRWRTVADVSDSFYSARLDVSRQCRLTELDTDPADERWGSFELDSVTLVGDKVTIRCTVTSAAGSTYTFLTPIPVTIK